MKLELDNITLLLYDISDKKHNELLNDFEGNSKSQYIHNISDRIKNSKNNKNFPFNTGFFVLLNDNIVGYIFISNCVSDEVFLEYSILKEYRGRKYGQIILNDVSNYLMDNYNIKSISLDIDPSNIPSIKTALNCGYIIDEEEYLNRNMSGKILYHLDNYNYVSKRRNK